MIKYIAFIIVLVMKLKLVLILARIVSIALLAVIAPTALSADLGIAQRWLAFREHLPDDVRENIDRNVDGLEFELLAKVRRIEDRTWCDFISFHIPAATNALPGTSIPFRRSRRRD